MRDRERGLNKTLEQIVIVFVSSKRALGRVIEDRLMVMFLHLIALEYVPSLRSFQDYLTAEGPHMNSLAQHERGA
jgi:hypothetical protein